MVQITYLAAFFAGIASFVSPCVLPLIPAFLSYLGGVNLKDSQENIGARTKIFINTLFFVFGFVFVFSAFGVILNSVLSGISYDLSAVLSKIGGIIIIIFGLFSLGVIKLGFLEKEYKLKAGKTRYSYLTSFIFGATFAISWTPCVGAILGSIFTLAISQPAISFGLLFSYSFGLGIPFLLTGAFTAQASDIIRKQVRLMSYFNKFFGIILIIIGILVFTGDFVKIANFNFANGLLGG